MFSFCMYNFLVFNFKLNTQHNDQEESDSFIQKMQSNLLVLHIIFSVHKKISILKMH